MTDLVGLRIGEFPSLCRGGSALRRGRSGAGEQQVRSLTMRPLVHGFKGTRE
jgi:hypothetical protein